MPARGADDAELQLAVGDERDDGLRVEDGQLDLHLRVLPLELAEQVREHDRGGACGGADLEPSADWGVVLTRDVGEQLLLELEHPLCAAVEAEAGLGRRDAAAGAVEQLRAEPLLERPDLQADRRLRDSEARGRLREAATFDDGAEGGELTSIHKFPGNCILAAPNPQV